MTFLAGQTLTTDVLNGHVPQKQTATGSTTSIASSSYTGVTGASLSVTATGANAYALVTAYYDATATVTASNNVLEGAILVDGSLHTEILSDDRQSRCTKTVTAVVTLSAGVHTVSIAAKRAAGTFTINDAKLIVLLYDLP